jgi:hypothetical protein
LEVVNYIQNATYVVEWPPGRNSGAKIERVRRIRRFFSSPLGVPVLVLFVFFVLVIIVVGTSRRHGVAP